MGRLAITTFAIGVSLLATTLPAVRPADMDHDSPAVIASFEGRMINLSQSWEDAEACFSDDDGTRCYRSEDEMDNAEMTVSTEVVSDSTGTTDRSCSAALRLYRGIAFTGGVLSLSTQHTTLNLASYGFNNDTSSYRIGPCAARFYYTTNGSGLYPGNTGANVWSAAMTSGWDNRIGSVYIL